MLLSISIQISYRYIKYPKLQNRDALFSWVINLSILLVFWYSLVLHKTFDISLKSYITSLLINCVLKFDLPVFMSYCIVYFIYI